MANFKALARQISIVENEAPGYKDLLLRLSPGTAKVLGITGPPGGGKSSLTDALIGEMVAAGKCVAVLCVDPSSPFNQGALLGDRIRMSSWYNHPDVYIRSLASRGALGGLHPNIIEVTELVKSSGFDFVIVETVGVGQSEIDIAGLADITVVVLVPEGGDVVQTMKAGIMEIADVFVINKSDRPDAEQLYANVKKLVREKAENVPVIKTVASMGKGVDKLYQQIVNHSLTENKDLMIELLVRRVWAIVQKQRMKDFDVTMVRRKMKEALLAGNLNLYQIVEEVNR